jgi:hypothetical protein
LDIGLSIETVHAVDHVIRRSVRQQKEASTLDRERLSGCPLALMRTIGITERFIV